MQGVWFLARQDSVTVLVVSMSERELETKLAFINCHRWGRAIRKHVQGRLQLHLSSSSEPPDCAVAALTELFAADRRVERNDTWLSAPLALTFRTVNTLVARHWIHW